MIYHLYVKYDIISRPLCMIYSYVDIETIKNITYILNIVLVLLFNTLLDKLDKDECDKLDKEVI